MHRNDLRHPNNEQRWKSNREKICNTTKNFDIIDNINELEYQKHSILKSSAENMILTNSIIRLNDCNDLRNGRKLFEDTILNSLNITTDICGLEHMTRNNMSSTKFHIKNTTVPQKNFEGCVVDKIRLKKSSSLNEISHHLHYNREELLKDSPSNGVIVNGFRKSRQKL